MTTLPATNLPFLNLAPGVGAGLPRPAGWQPLDERAVLILVGVTGVGKSTALDALAAQGVGFSLLPDRRDLTDSLVIAAMQAADGLPIEPVRDRAQRFDYTRRFRALHAGGIAHALRLLAVDPAQMPGLLAFDGLRGDHEIAHACASLPFARFIMLDAPDAVRVVRLLGRGDAFDQIAVAPPPSSAAGALELGEASALFSPAEVTLLVDLVARGIVSADELRAKAQIVAEERRGYDPAATRRALREHAADRTLIVDTTRHDSVAVAGLMAAQLAAWSLI